MQTHFFPPPPTKSRMEIKKVQQGEQKYVYRSRSLLRLTDRCEPRLFQDKTLVSWEEAERGFRDAAVMMTLLRESAPASSHSCRGPPVEKRCHYEIHILTDVKKRERALEFGWNSEPLWALGWIFWWRCFAFRLCHLDVFFICFFNNNNSSLLKGPWNRLCELRQEHILNDFGGFHRLLHKARLPDPTHCVSTTVCGLCQNV